MSFLAITIPVSLVLAGMLLYWVLRRAGDGDFDDWEGPAARMIFDDDSEPEREASRSQSHPPSGSSGPTEGSVRGA